MIIIDCEQNSPEWYAARLGKPTASEFKNIITAAGAKSSGGDSYGNMLMAELMAGEPLETFSSDWMKRGQQYETEAANAYSFIFPERKVVRIGFCTNDEGSLGCSPDRLVDDDGLLETKCPSPAQHVKYLLTRKIDRDYYPQLQGQLFVTGRQWVDWMSYHPKLAPCIIRLYRIEEYIEKMEKYMGWFLEALQVKKERLVQLGHMS